MKLPLKRRKGNLIAPMPGDKKLVLSHFAAIFRCLFSEKNRIRRLSPTASKILNYRKSSGDDISSFETKTSSKSNCSSLFLSVVVIVLSLSLRCGREWTSGRCCFRIVCSHGRLFILKERKYFLNDDLFIVCWCWSSVFFTGINFCGVIRNLRGILAFCGQFSLKKEYLECKKNNGLMCLLFYHFIRMFLFCLLTG